ncbi:hypothetical protein CTAYLR_008926 [Chrysophaeum taylorii]|uniref:Cyclic nucleotide-binding domain-containing protein n=1 Tax=Chrysophaeum taylorii TaxID=2483200 RepID=A0AAD7UHK7_9STRA|nr:hypothetical protein CTAYLR_008926 [Chrysophaeum taylorii]
MLFRIRTISPEARGRMYWDALIFVVIFYNCNMTPILIGMPPPRPVRAKLRAVDTFLDCLFVADTVARFFFAFVDRDTRELVTDPKQIRDAYVASWRFKLNLAAIVALFTRKKIVRMSRIGMLFDQLEAVRLVLGKTRLSDAGFRMLKIVATYVLLATSCGSFYFAVGNKHKESASWTDEVARAIYFMVQTLFTIGYGDIAPTSRTEIRFTLCLMVLGALTYALVIANMTSLLSNADVSNTRRHEELQAIVHYMDARDAPEALQLRTKQCFESIPGGILHQNLLEALPEKLRERATQHRVEMLANVPYFAHRETAFVVAAAAMLHVKIYVANSTVVFAREKRAELFLVKSGRLVLFTMNSPAPLDALGPGDFLGDFQLVLDVRHPVAARTYETVEIFSLARSDFGALLTQFRLSVTETDAGIVAMTEAYALRLKKWRARHHVDDVDDHLEEEEDSRRNNYYSLYWHPLMIVATFFSVVMVPIRTMLYTTHCPEVDPTLWIDWGLDLLFIADSAFFSKGYNLLFAIPFSMVFVVTSQHRCTIWIAVARFPHLGRILALAGHLAEFKKSLEARRAVPEKLFTMVRRAYETLFLIIFMACGWGIVRGGNKFSSAFAKALYYVLVTFTTVGYGDITPETIPETWFAVVAGTVGATFFAGIVANITSFVHTVDVSEDNVAHKKTVMATFMSESGVSDSVQRRVFAFFEKADETSSTVVVDKYLPQNACDDLRVFATHRMVLASKVFRGAEAGFLRAIMLALEHRFFVKGEVLRNHYGMSFIFKGQGAVLVEEEKKVVAMLGPNTHFGEAAIFGDPVPYAVRCVVFNEHYFLSRLEFEQLLLRFPQRKLDHMRRQIQVFGGEGSNLNNDECPDGFVDPDGAFMRYWTPLILFFVLWNVMAVPYRVFYSHVIALDYLGDALFVADILIRARYLTFMEGDLLIFDRRRIFAQYDAFPRHVVASIPFDLAYLAGGHLSLLRANKLLRCVDAPFLATYCERRLKRRKNFVRMCRLVLAIIVCSHVFGAAFFAIARHRGQNCHRYDKARPDKLCPNWAQEYLDTQFRRFAFPPVLVNATSEFHAWGTTRSDRRWQQYTSSLYWGAATITTVGYGDISATSLAEVLFSIVCLVISVIIYTLIVANLEDIVGNLDVTTTLYNQKRDHIERYCLRSYLPETFRESINDYYDKLWDQQKGGKKVLQLIPGNLRSALVLDLVGHVLERYCDGFALEQLALALTLDLYMPLDFLFQSGECAETLFFMSSGSAVLKDDDAVIATVTEGPLGEAAFFLRVLYPFSAQISEVSQVLSITFEEFEAVLRRNGLRDEFFARLIKRESELEQSHYRTRKTTTFKPQHVTSSNPAIIVHPNSWVKRTWHAACLAGAFYSLVSVPYEIAFSPRKNYRVFFPDLFFFALYAIDVCLNMTIFAVRRQGRVITDPSVFRPLYVRTRFRWDIIATSPFSLIFESNTLRLLQLVRLKHTNLSSINLPLSGDMTFLLILVVSIIVVCHWLGCAFYALGEYELGDAACTQNNKNVWICANDLQGKRWLVSFYWALYTCSTIGYGAVEIRSNAEKIFCILAMIIGAVMCDAGITAVLTAFIEHKDHEAGSKKRRIECAKIIFDNPEPVVRFFEEKDCNEPPMLGDLLNAALRNRILKRAAFQKLIDSLLFGGLGAGCVATLVYEMRPVIACPGERILQIGQPDLFVFESGLAHSVDSCGDKEFIATGAVLSNIEFRQVAKRVGVPTKQLAIRVGRARNLRATHNYVLITVESKTVFGQSVKKCHTKLRKHTTYPYYDEMFRIKAFSNSEIKVTAMRWRRGLDGIELGSCWIPVDCDAWFTLFRDDGKRAGDVHVKSQFSSLDRSSIAKNAELTVIADSFCHLYLLDHASQDKVKKYTKAMRLPYAKRLAAATPPQSVAYLPPDEVLEAMTDGDEEMSLTNPTSRGFDAYMSETFAKRATKGSVMVRGGPDTPTVKSLRRLSSTAKTPNTFKIHPTVS